MQNQYYFEYDSKGDIVKTYLQNIAPTPTSGNTILGGFMRGSASNDVVSAFNFPNRYLVVSKKLVEQPYIELSYSEGTTTIGTAPESYSAVDVTVTATLNGTVTTAPTEVEFSIFGATYKETITSNQAVFTFDVHPSLNDPQISINASASGYVGNVLNVGTNVPSVAISSEHPSGFKNPIIHPSGTGAKNFLTAYWTSVSTDSAFSMIDISAIIGLHSDMLYGVLIPQLVTSKAITLDANQQNFADFMKKSILPVIPSSTETAAPVPASGATQGFDTHFGHYQQTQISAAQAMHLYAWDLKNFTNVL